MSVHAARSRCHLALLTLPMLPMLLMFSAATGCQSAPAIADAPQTVFPTTPLKQDFATITATGLSCPLCANNIDSTLKKLPGVQTVDVDLNTGRITVGLFGKAKPSKASLATAVVNAGFTVLSVE